MIRWFIVDNRTRTIVREFVAYSRDEARRLAGRLSEAQYVVSAASYKIGDTREVQRARLQWAVADCKGCDKPISGAEHDAAHAGWHRRCYERDLRARANALQRELAAQRKRAYLERQRRPT